MRFKTLLALTFALGMAMPSLAQITPVGPFTGTYFDNFNNIGTPGSGGHQQLDVFTGFATVRNLTQGGSLKIEFSSQLGSDLVVPRSSPAMLGQLGISEWTFDGPVNMLGGYWENNSRFDDAIIDFFDANNNLIGTLDVNVPRSAQVWTWNGWESTVPFSKVVITGNDVGFLNGFIWFEDFNVTVAAVPEPSTYALICLTGAVGAGVCFLRRRKVKKLQEMV